MACVGSNSGRSSVNEFSSESEGLKLETEMVVIWASSLLTVVMLQRTFDEFQ